MRFVDHPDFFTARDKRYTDGEFAAAFAYLSGTSRCDSKIPSIPVADSRDQLPLGYTIARMSRDYRADVARVRRLVRWLREAPAVGSSAHQRIAHRATLKRAA